MKIKRLLSITLCIAMVIGLVPAMSMTASAAKMCKIGVWYNAPTYEVETEYGPSTWKFKVSEAGMVEFSDNDKQMKFLKPGKVTITTEWYRTDVRGKTLVPVYGSFTNEYEVDGTAQPIQTTTIKLESGKFIGGGTFPHFTVASDSNCTVEEATFYAEMCDYYPGDKLPSYRSGTPIKNISITLKPNPGYMFAFGGSNDDKFHENTVYTVEYNGKKYTPYVKHNITQNEMFVYVDTTLEEGSIYTTTIKELDAPYHYGPLDKTAKVEDALEIVSIKYTMFNKELESFAKGDNIGVVVRVKTKDSTNKINPDGKAYWMEQKVYSVQTTAISDNEVEYAFAYKVDAIPEQYISHVSVGLPAYAVGDKPMSTGYSYTKGINVTEVKFVESFDKFEAGKEYTANIILSKDKEYLFADDVTADVNGESVEFSTEKDSGGSKGKFEKVSYCIVAKVVPQQILDVVTTPTPGTVVDGDKKDEFITGTIVTQTPEPTKAPDPTEKPSDNGSGSSGGSGNDDKSDVVYGFPFEDVYTTEWYYTSVKSAYEMGLINGKSAAAYNPNDNMTFAEAVKLAACMNILYKGKDPSKEIANGKDVWFSTYMDYALKNGIIDEDLTAVADNKVTRAEYVYIFSKALPDKAFAKKNDIPTGSIPDVKSEMLSQDKAIYKFYRAGILAGNDSIGTFNPSGNITRAEVAAILIRMMDTSTRVGAPKDLGK